jgi:hypothetical protein
MLDDFLKDTLKLTDFKEDPLPQDKFTLGMVFFFFYSYVHTMFGSFSPPFPTISLAPLPPPSSPIPSLPSRNYFALISNFVEERV